MASPVAAGRQQIEDALKTKPTLVVGIDFLFWFCYGRGIEEAQRLPRLEKGLQLLDQIKCPLIIGDIPDASAAIGHVLSAEEVPTTNTLALANEKIRRWAGGRTNVAVLPIAKLMRALATNKSITIHGQAEPDGKTRLFLQEDDLHPTPSGCALLAESIFDAWCAAHPALPQDDLCWDRKIILKHVLGTSQAEQP
jgi:hypothetical protein